MVVDGLGQLEQPLEKTVQTGRREQIAAAGHVTRLPGGRGAVREVCDLLLGADK